MYFVFCEILVPFWEGKFLANFFRNIPMRRKKFIRIFISKTNKWKNVWAPPLYCKCLKGQSVVPIQFSKSEKNKFQRSF